MTEERGERAEDVKKRSCSSLLSGWKLEVEGRHPAGPGEQCCTSSRVFFCFFLLKKRRVELSVIWFAVTVEDSECDGGANMFIERKSKRNPTERERESSGEYRNQLLCCGVQESRNRVQLR